MAKKNTSVIEIDEVVVKFAGDSGDGMQLIGTQFSDTSGIVGNEVNTFPDYPSEIRAPEGTLYGVSAFQVHFGKKNINTTGDFIDVLVCMNASSLKVNLPNLKNNGIINYINGKFPCFQNIFKGGRALVHLNGNIFIIFCSHPKRCNIGSFSAIAGDNNLIQPIFFHP